MEIRVNLSDTFSGASRSVEKEVTKEQWARLETIQMNQTVIEEFSDNIRWEWVIEEIEILAV